MTDMPKWEAITDWSDLPDVYVVRADRAQGMFWRVEACSVPMAIGPEVRLIRADVVEARIAEAVAKEREACARIADKRVDVIVSENGSWEPDTNVTNLPEWAETACEELEALAAAIRSRK